ncbi:MAG: AAA domain-containing protein [Pseudomonadota bacterium]
MAEDRSSLGLPRIKEGREAARLSFSEGRYVTRGAPRSGGLASVYKATDLDTGETVAIKVFRTGEGTDDVVEESFRREVQALSDLNHPNIVRIRASGRDIQDAAHFIVMDWIEEDLNAFFERQRFAKWDDFFDVIGRAILDGLVFAYSNAIVHRDVKPSNILIDEGGQPKICDFGISKIRDFLAPGVTLAQFASAPFAPPEFDDGNYSYSRDVFGYAAVAISALSEKTPSNQEELLHALEDVALDEDIRRLLRLCLSLDNPAARPPNVLLLQAELQKLKPRLVRQPRGVVIVALTNKLRGIIEYDLALRGDRADRFVERDLEDASCEELPPQQDRPNRSVRIYGQKYGYTAVVDDSKEKLLLVSALEFSPSELEAKRNRACTAEYKFAVRGPSGTDSQAAIDALLEQILAFSADQKLRVMEQREQALYRTWLDLLSAKTDLEKQHKVSAHYDGIESSGEFVRLILVQGFDTSLFADQDVIVDVGGKSFSGSVISFNDNSVLMRPNERSKIQASELPRSGVLEADTTKSDVALDKQKSALEAVRYGRSVNPNLGKFILNPGEIPIPAIADVEFIQSHIDDDKKNAVLTALSGPELMLVEGPPGTGKTTFITELVLQTLRESPNARILLTSQTHVALDNSLERIVGNGKFPVRAVRIGNENDERISTASKKLLLDAKLPEMRKEALASGRNFIENWAARHGVSHADTRKAMALERHAGLKARLEELDEAIADLMPQLSDEAKKALDAEQQSELDERMQGLTHERDELDKELKLSFKSLNDHFDNKSDLKEYADCSASELRIWADAHSNGTASGTQLKKLLLAHADWEIRFGRSQEFRTAVIASSQIVAGTCLGVMGVPGRNEITYDLCIVDEASIATPTEALVPMSRARRTVLVGDNMQLSPFQDPRLKSAGLLTKYNLSPEDQKATLFRLLTDQLPPALRKRLTTQHRMIPAIGNLVSNCFYGGDLNSIDRTAAAHVAGALPRAVTWFSTSRLPDRASRKIGSSHFNSREVEQVLLLLKRIDFFVQRGRNKDKKISVAVLTGYGEQKQRLRTAIQARRHEWASYSEIFVNVVDAFQGREADMVIFSVTRSEAKGLGFLREMERINVALSRAKELLAIVGDHYYCQTVETTLNPLRDVIDYIRCNPSDCALEELQP